MSEATTIAAATSRRGVAKRAVQIWAIELEEAMAGKSRHPLHQVRELHLANMPNHSPPAKRPVTLKTASGGEITHWTESLTARGVATRSAGGSRPLVNITTRSAGEIHKIMRHLELVDHQYWQTLLAWGLGFTLENQAKTCKVSKATIQRRFEGGLAIVQSCLLGRFFSD